MGGPGKGYQLTLVILHNGHKMVVVTFCVSRRRRKMYCSHAHLYVCLYAAACPLPTLLHGPWMLLGVVVGDAP